MSYVAEWDVAHRKREMIAKVVDHRLEVFMEPIFAAPRADKWICLDVGCGTGRSAEWMASKGWCTVHAFDSSPTAILRAYDRLLVRKEPIPSFMVADTTKPWPYRSDAFDVVVDIRSLENLTKDEIAFAWGQAFRVLKVGGQFLSITAHPDRNDKLTAAGKVTKLSEDDLGDMAEESGFHATCHRCVVEERGKRVVDWHVTSIKP